MSISPPTYQYRREDTEYVFHQHDEMLDTIKIKLPSLTDFYSRQLKREVSWDEAITYVDGYGLAPDDQVFVHQKMPEKLKTIYEVVFSKLRDIRPAQYKDITDISSQEIYDEIENNQDYYKDEIKWIKLQIKRRYVGYWFFKNGKPTYLNGANYFFMNFWHVKNRGKNNNLPDYRDYQRGIFTFLHYAHTTTDEFYKHEIYWNQDGEVKRKYFNDWKEVNDYRKKASRTRYSVWNQKRT